MKRPDVVVVGAGVIGLTTAWALLQAGRHPLVLEAGEPARESSWAGGGIICPVPPWRYPQTVNQLVFRSRELFPALIAGLEQDSGIDCEYQVSGLLLLGELFEQGREWLAAEWPGCRSGRASDFEPQLRPPEAPAVLLPDVPQVRNPRLARALVIALQRCGVELRACTPVRYVECATGRVTGLILASGERLPVDELVLAAGAWTDRLLEASGLSGLGIEPVRGQMLLFRPRRRLLRHIVNHGRGYLIPRRDGRILAGSSAERVGFDRRPQARFYREALAMARSCLPGLQESDMECHWLGFRPGMRGDLPAIGAYPGIHGLWLNAGHYRNGLGMAPASAELLLDCMRGPGRALACQVRPLTG